jgi:hypothetical protein
MDGSVSNPAATYGGVGPVMGHARFTWRKDGVEWSDARYVAGLTEDDARESMSMAGYVSKGAEFVAAEWLSAEDAAKGWDGRINA